MSSDALTRFEEEHRVGLKVLEHLEQAALALRRGVDVTANMALAREMCGLLRSEVRPHNEAEERALFPLLGDHPGLQIFVDEHREMRRLEQKLAAGLDAGDAQRVAGIALHIVDLLRSHIEREDHMLFPSARAALGPEGLAEVERRLAP
jgi:hemerythrin-like domain-containing protein